VGILFLDFQAFHRPSFPPTVLVLLEAQLTPKGEAEDTEERVPECVQVAEPHRSVENLEVALIETS
jgi:hypothetical protein